MLVQSGTGDSILSNSIFSNGHLGIDLAAAGDPPSGVTPNGPGVRVGPNNLQNTPVMTAVVAGTEGAVAGELEQPPEYAVPDSVLQQYGGRSIGLRPGPDVARARRRSRPMRAVWRVVSLTPQDGVPANTWVSATATNLLTGDTSEFAQDLSAQPVSVQFDDGAVRGRFVGGRGDDPGRARGQRRARSFRSSTPPATAPPSPASNTCRLGNSDVSARPGLLGADFPDHDPAQPEPVGGDDDGQPDADASLAGGATLGAISTAMLTISELPAPPPPPPPPPPIDLIAPRLTSEQLIVNGQVDHRDRPGLQQTDGCQPGTGSGATTATSSTRPEPTASSAAAAAAMSASARRSTARHSQTVTLTPSVPLAAEHILASHGRRPDEHALEQRVDGFVEQPADRLRRQGRDARSSSRSAAGKRLVYTDSRRNVVKLQLTKGGLDGDVPQRRAATLKQLQLIGTIARKTTLSGSVSRGRGGTGRTILPPIAGAAGVRVRLKTPPFVFRTTSLVTDAELSKSSSGRSGDGRRWLAGLWCRFAGGS